MYMLITKLVKTIKLFTKEADRVSPLHTNKFQSKKAFLSPKCSLRPTKLAWVPTNTAGYAVPNCSRFIRLFTQATHTKQLHTKNKDNILNFTVYLEKYHSMVQQLAYRGWP